MQINDIIKWFSVLFWLLPPVRQYGGRYFYYFMVLALIDPLTMLIYHFLNINPLNVFVFFSLLLIYSLLNLKGAFKSVFLIVLLLTTLYFGYLNTLTAHITVIVLHLIILSIIITHFFQTIGKEQVVNFFLVAIFLYETTIVIKMYSILIRANHQMVYYYITTGFEILLALFFIIFRYDNKRIHANLYSGHRVAERESN